MTKNKKRRKKRNDKAIIAAAAVAAVVVIAAVTAVMIGSRKNAEDASVDAAQIGQTPGSGTGIAGESDGFVEIEPGVFMNINGEIWDDSAMQELAEGENPQDIEVQVKQLADYVEPGPGTLNIDKIQGFTAKPAGSSSGSSGKGGSSTKANSQDSQDAAPASDQNGEDQNGGAQADDGQTGSDPAGNDQNGSVQDGTMNGTDLGTVLSDSNLAVNAVGSYSGSYLEDGSDKPTSNVAALLITNNSSKMLQVAQVTFQVNDSETAVFRVTDLPAGTSALVMEQSGREYRDEDDYSYGRTATAYIDMPSLESDKFDVEMEQGKVRLNNKTDESYSKVYVYYKYVQLGGAYKGGITYRTPVENVPANGSAEAVAGHMNPDSMQIVDVQIVE